MKNTMKSLKVGLSFVLLISAVSLNACGGRIKPATQVALPTATAPADNFYQQDPSADLYNNNSNEILNSVVPSTPNTQSGSFPVDQATLNQWQAKGIAVSGGAIYLSVSDTSGLSKKGSIVKMNSSDGKDWKDLASKWLGLSHPIDATVTGLAVSGGTVIAADSTSKMYLVDAAKGTVTTVKSTGGTDVTSGSGNIFIANGNVVKSDYSVSAVTPITGLTATAGIGSDNMGSVFAISGSTVKKADTTGQVFDIVTTDLSAPIDVAVDNRNGDLYVLEQSMIKRFNSNGQLLISFANGSTKPVGIATDETGAIYVADAGSTNKDSKVVKFSPATDIQTGASQMNSYNSNSNSSAYNSYAAYSNTRK